jgi:hypothetical protein
MFVLPNINFERIGKKYGDMSLFESEKPANKTMIGEISNTDSAITMITAGGIFLKKDMEISCFWDKKKITSPPIGCPIKFYDAQVSQEYNSHITGERYNIIKKICAAPNFNEYSGVEFSNHADPFYVVDAICCSWNCALSNIIDEVARGNILYQQSEKLLYKMRFDMTKRTDRITPAPHWRLLKKFGGNLSIKVFRDKLESTEYEIEDFYTPICVMTGCMYKENINYKIE